MSAAEAVKRPWLLNASTRESIMERQERISISRQKMQRQCGLPKEVWATRSLVERNDPADQAHVNRVPGDKFSPQYGFRQRIFDLHFDDALQRSRAEF